MRATLISTDSIEYKNGMRALSQVAGPDGGISRPVLSIRDIEAVLSDEVSWS